MIVGNYQQPVISAGRLGMRKHRAMAIRKGAQSFIYFIAVLSTAVGC